MTNVEKRKASILEAKLRMKSAGCTIKGYASRHDKSAGWFYEIFRGNCDSYQSWTLPVYLERDLKYLGWLDEDWNKPVVDSIGG